MTKIVPFEIEHFDRMDLKPGIWAKRSDRAMIEAYGKAGWSVSLLDDELIIACGGVACAAWKGFGEFWLIPSIYVPHYPKAVYSAARCFIQSAIDNMDLYRVQATIGEDDAVSVRWIERLGFEREGLMKKFGPGRENKYLYARVS